MTKEVIARISAQAAELMVRYEDLTVGECIHMACIMESLLYGHPDEPRHELFGRSIIQSVKDRIK